MKKVKKLVLIIFVAILVISFLNIHSLADGFGDLSDFEGRESDNLKSATNTVHDVAGTAVSVMRIVCAAIAIVMLLVIAMKYMISSPGDRADIKKSSINYVIGAFILFAAAGILSIIDDISQTIKVEE